MVDFQLKTFYLICFFVLLLLKNIVMFSKNVFIVVLLNSCFFAFSQAPSISYQTPNTFLVNQNNISLLPTNSGGSIPAEPIVITYAGTGTIGTINGSLQDCQFNFPTVVVFDNNDNLIVVDRSNHKIRKIENQIVSTIAGTGAIGSADGVGSLATFKYPDGAIVDSNGNIFITDQSNHKIRRIDVAGNVTTIAGTGAAGYLDGTGITTKFYYPASMAIDEQDNLFIADYGNHCVRKITPLGVVSTYAGIGGTAGNLDGNQSSATFRNPTGLCFDNEGNLYVADYGNHKIRKIDAFGNVSTFAGTGIAGNTDGPALNASFNSVGLIAFDKIDTFYVTDSGNNKIRKIDASGTVSTFAGTGTIGAIDGAASLASFNEPTGMVIKNKNEFFISDYGNHKIRKITQYGYSISPNLPVGLIFNTITGEISGTATEISPMTAYTVSVTNEDGESTFILNIEVTSTASTASFSKNEIIIYPNPAIDILVIESTNEIPKSIVIINLLGQQIKTIVPANQNETINISDIKSGVYIIKFLFDTTEENQQFIKK